MHVTGYHNIFTNFLSQVLGCLWFLQFIFKYMCDTYIDTFVCICICMSVILSVFILGSVVDFIHTWNELYNMLMLDVDDTSKFWVTYVGVGCSSTCNIQLWHNKYQHCENYNYIL